MGFQPVVKWVLTRFSIADDGLKAHRTNLAPMQHVRHAIVGLGIAGATLAWRLKLRGESVAVIDNPEPHSSSRVAAGLITPFTGQRFALTPRWEEFWPVAETFYRRIEELTQTSFFTAAPAVRLFDPEQFHQLAAPRIARSPTLLRRCETPSGCGQPGDIAVEMLTAARVDVPAYLAATREYFSSHGEYYEAKFDLDAPPLVTNDGVTIPALGLQCEHLIYCTGCYPPPREFAWLPFECAKGELLTVEIPDLALDQVLHRNVWLAPRGGNRYQLGATFDRLSKKGTGPIIAPNSTSDCDWFESNNWTCPLFTPTAAARGTPHQTCRNHAATRRSARTRRRHPPHPARPDADRHIRCRQQATLDVHRPRLEGMLGGAAARGKFSGASHRRFTARSRPDSARRPMKRLVDQAQDFVRAVVKPGETVIDATAGGGRDTLFLAQLVGQAGVVHAFDVQAAAIAETALRLQAAGVTNVTLHPRNHAEMLDVLPAELVGQVAAVMFNLGYHPGGDQQVVTRADSTLAALRRN